MHAGIRWLEMGWGSLDDTLQDLTKAIGVV